MDTDPATLLSSDEEKHTNEEPQLKAPEKNGYLKTLIPSLLGIHILIATGILITGCLALQHCDEVQYAGMTPITGSLFLLLGFLTAAAYLTKIPIVWLILSIFNVMLSSVILIFDTHSYLCTREGLPLLPSYGRCRIVRSALNFCKLLKEDNPIPMSNTPADTFVTGRIALIILATFAVIIAVAQLTALSAALKVKYT